MYPHTDILKLLRSSSMSLADLQHETQVSLPTLRKAVQELTDARWIRITGQAEVNSGRPPKMFGFDSTAFVIIGVHVQLPGLHMVTTDLNGQVLDEQRIVQADIPQPQDVLDTITDYVLSVREILADRVILGIGIAAPGFIDPESGDILLIGRVPDWQNIPICTRLQVRLGLPVHVGNDVDCMAFAEFRHSGMPFDRHLIYVGFDEGVKASLFLNGELYKGALGNPGLIASHLLHVDSDAALNHDGLRPTIHNINAVFSRQADTLSPAERARYTPILSIKDPRQRFEHILQADPDEYPLCLEVVRLMNDMVAVAVANLIFIIQPSVCVLGGMLSLLSPQSFADVERRIRSYLLPIINHKIDLQPGRVMSANNAAVGATHYFFEHYLASQDDILSQPNHSPADPSRLRF